MSKLLTCWTRAGEVCQLKFEVPAFPTLDHTSWLLPEGQGTSTYGRISFVLDLTYEDIVNKTLLPCPAGGEGRDVEELDKFSYIKTSTLFLTSHCLVSVFWFVWGWGGGRVSHCNLLTQFKSHILA